MFSDFYICCSNLVGPARENWNYIFSDLQLLCERLDELDIEATIGTHYTLTTEPYLPS
jgi:hypothetical protein